MKQKSKYLNYEINFVATIGLLLFLLFDSSFAMNEEIAKNNNTTSIYLCTKRFR